MPETCAEDKHAAMRVPLDVFFLLDGSGSMSLRVGNSNGPDGGALPSSVGVETGWFTHTDAGLPPLDEYFQPQPAAAPSRALLIAGLIAGGVLAVGVGIAIAMIAL